MKQITRQHMVCRWVLALLVMTALPCSNVSAGKMVLVSSQDTKESLYGSWLNLIYTEVFRRLGYEFEYVGYPGGRAPVLAEAGEVDGEIHRGIDYEKTTRNLLRVSEPHFTISYMAYAVTPGIVLSGWESLKNTSYPVEYRRGAKIPEAALPGVVKANMLSDVTIAELGFKKLIEGRIVLYIEQEAVALKTLKKLKMAEFNTESVYSAGIMYSGESYVYLHKKHAGKLPQIAETLRTMKQEGVIERYKDVTQEAQ